MKEIVAEIVETLKKVRGDVALKAGHLKAIESLFSSVKGRFDPHLHEEALQMYKREAGLLQEINDEKLELGLNDYLTLKKRFLSVEDYKEESFTVFNWEIEEEFILPLHSNMDHTIALRRRISESVSNPPPFSTFSHEFLAGPCYEKNNNPSYYESKDLTVYGLMWVWENWSVGSFYPDGQYLKEDVNKIISMLAETGLNFSSDLDPLWDSSDGKLILGDVDRGMLLTVHFEPLPYDDHGLSGCAIHLEGSFSTPRAILNQLKEIKQKDLSADALARRLSNGLEKAIKYGEDPKVWFLEFKHQMGPHWEIFKSFVLEQELSSKLNTGASGMKKQRL